MIAQTPWVERKFNFDFPAGLYPGLLERLAGTPARMEEMVDGLSEEMLVKKPLNKWSVKEQIGHLADLDAIHEGRLDDFKAGKEMLRAADMTNAQTNEAHHNAKPVGQLLHNFRIVRNNFVTQLRTVDEKLLVVTAIHPRLKIPMRLVDMIYFCCEHDDHHLAKIRYNITI